MKIYDFDGTIYDGDSSVDFFRFCIKQNLWCLRILPVFGVYVVLYFLKLCSKEKMKSAYFRFVRCFDDINSVVVAFWEEHEDKIKEFYLKQKQADDIIISASPTFLLKPICERLCVTLIATETDPKSGKLLGKNCHGEEKVLRLRSVTDCACEEFYSDSQSDAPLAKLAKRAYLVKGSEIKEWNI